MTAPVECIAFSKVDCVQAKDSFEQSRKGFEMKKRLVRLAVLVALTVSFEAAAMKPRCLGSWVWGPMYGWQCVEGGLNDGECAC